jgi:hypothetical protein
MSTTPHIISDSEGEGVQRILPSIPPKRLKHDNRQLLSVLNHEYVHNDQKLAVMPDQGSASNNDFMTKLGKRKRNSGKPLKRITDVIDLTKDDEEMDKDKEEINPVLLGSNVKRGIFCGVIAYIPKTNMPSKKVDILRNALLSRG